MQIVRCGRCGMMYQNPRIAESEMEDAYELLEEYKHYSILADSKRKLFQKRIQSFSATWGLPDRGAFLDIGASHGVMLDTIREVLPRWDVAGVEISPSMRGALIQRGHRVYPSLSGIDASARFDWINLDNVLEHIPDPVATLAKLRRHLRPGAFVYIDVPNESFFQLRYRINDAVRGFKKAPTFPGHVNLFTPATLEKTCVTAGFRCERIWQESLSAPHRLGAMAGVSATRRAEAVMKLLRFSRLDVMLRAAYYICARIRVRG